MHSPIAVLFSVKYYDKIELPQEQMNNKYLSLNHIDKNLYSLIFWQSKILVIEYINATYILKANKLLHFFAYRLSIKDGINDSIWISSNEYQELYKYLKKTRNVGMTVLPDKCAIHDCSLQLAVINDVYINVILTSLLDTELIFHLSPHHHRFVRKFEFFH